MLKILINLIILIHSISCIYNLQSLYYILLLILLRFATYKSFKTYMIFKTFKSFKYWIVFKVIWIFVALNRSKLRLKPSLFLLFLIHICFLFNPHVTSHIIIIKDATKISWFHFSFDSLIILIRDSLMFVTEILS